MKITKNRPVENPAMSAIAQGTKFTGNIEATNPIRIDGELDGNISSESKIVLGPKSSITGTIEAQEVVVSGYVQGTISAKSVITLQPDAHVDGDLEAKEFVIEAGAKFNGSCAMLNETPTLKLEAKQA